MNIFNGFSETNTFSCVDTEMTNLDDFLNGSKKYCFKYNKINLNRCFKSSAIIDIYFQQVQWRCNNTIERFSFSLLYFFRFFIMLNMYFMFAFFYFITILQNIKTIYNTVIKFILLDAVDGKKLNAKLMSRNFMAVYVSFNKK